MIRIVKYPSKEERDELCKRPSLDTSSLRTQVKSIIHEVQMHGDSALKAFSEKFDGAILSSLLSSNEEIEILSEKIDEPLKTAIHTAAENIQTFHKAQREKTLKVSTTEGVECWRKSVGIEHVGLYIPGGSAPLFSTLLMLAIPARIAGCKEIVLCTPPNKQGEIHPAILYAAKISGVSRIFKVGGAQAIAAMALGTESIPKVDKIFGPGNQYVTCAKQLLQQEGIAIDLPAGPSEILVIADSSTQPAYTAADLLSQAEHGPDSQVILISTDSDFLIQCNRELENQLKLLPRAEIAIKALKNSYFILVNNLKEAIDLSNAYAPEHLILSCKGYETLADEVVNAGSVFLGNYSPESAGDYASGTNHTLPTSGYARAYSGVSLDSFVKKITFQKLTKQGLKNLAPTIETMAEAEGLKAHKNAVTIRLITQ